MKIETGIALPLVEDVQQNVESSWPPPPMHIRPRNISPPKPDTPPTNVS